MTQRKPDVVWDVVILTHPLRPAFEAVIAEYERGFQDYGPWSEMSEAEQTTAVRSECFEWMAANLKTRNRAERERQELIHLMNVAGKRWVELGRDGKPEPEYVAVCRRLVAAGYKIQAIKEWRIATGVGLGAAKAAVEAL